MAPLTVHHLENSRSQRVLWLLEELEVPYELIRYERDPKTYRAPQKLRKLHPLGKSPVVTDGGEIVLAESGAIVEHLVEHHGQGRLRPEPGTEAHRRYRFWLHYAEGSLMPPLLIRFIFNRLKTAPLPFFLKPVIKGIVSKVDQNYTGPEIVRHVEFIEGELGQHQWFAGDDFSAADVQMSFPLEALAVRGGLSRPHPKIDAFLRRIHARPAYQKALERGGPYELGAG
ncbi:MAG: glutathione S-transferase [Myxococcota bacterium]